MSFAQSLTGAPAIIIPKQEPIILAVDSQVVDAISMCETRAHNMFNLSIRPIIRNDWSLDFGGLWHEYMRFHYIMLKEGKLDYQSIIRETKAKVHQYVLKHPEKLTSVTAVDIAECERAYQEYADLKQYDTAEILDVEVPFTKLLWESEAIKIYYQGIIDLFTRVPQIGRLPWDHKMVGDLGRYKPYPLMNQMKGYCWATECPNILVNRARQDPMADVKETHKRFERIIFSYTPEMLEEWRINTALLVLNYYGQVKDELIMMRTSSCDKYGGCPYQRLCSADPGHRAFIVQTEYERVPVWDPLKRDH